ncbi:hypothetical protein [Marinobacterium aestuariivivens]|uniref:Poly(3-hydroxyalkanoate) polymerase subunit PhaE n=1 Tax=Marinobacterium aestuariivivens TaxID=1698799 RepID=A0ABW2A411_9GAMM
MSNDTFVEPKLAEALQHWSDYTGESLQNERVVLQAITPLKDSAQLSQQLIESLRESGWPTSAWPDPTRLSQAAAELTDIQLAAWNRMLDGYSTFLKTSVEAGSRLGEVAQQDGDPQRQLAAWLEAWLAITRQYQSDFSNQLSNLNAIQAAYRAWWQKTLQSAGKG